MSRALPVAYTVQSAQAALKLGPVKYICNICGGTHVSKESPPRYCVVARVRCAGASFWAGDALDALAGAIVPLATELRNERDYVSYRTAGTAGSHACGNRVRPATATVDETGISRVHSWEVQMDAVSLSLSDAYHVVDVLLSDVHYVASIISLLSSNSSLRAMMARLKALPRIDWLSSPDCEHYNNPSWTLMAEPDCVHEEILRIARFRMRGVRWPPVCAADKCRGITRRTYDRFLTAFAEFQAGDD